MGRVRRVTAFRLINPRNFNPPSPSPPRRGEGAGAFCCVVTLTLCAPFAYAGHDRYLLINLHPSELNDATFNDIAALTDISSQRPGTGVGAIISYLRRPPRTAAAS